MPPHATHFQKNLLILQRTLNRRCQTAVIWFGLNQSSCMLRMWRDLAPQKNWVPWRIRVTNRRFQQKSFCKRDQERDLTNTAKLPRFGSRSISRLACWWAEENWRKSRERVRVRNRRLQQKKIPRTGSVSILKAARIWCDEIRGCWVSTATSERAAKVNPKSTAEEWCAELR